MHRILRSVVLATPNAVKLPAQFSIVYPAKQGTRTAAEITVLVPRAQVVLKEVGASKLYSLDVTGEVLKDDKLYDNYRYRFDYPSDTKSEQLPVVLDRFSPILHLVQSVRDEAHRFAVTFHRTRRNASRLTSELEEIPGVGKTTVTKLLKHFGSSALVREASEEDLARRVGRAAARRIRAYYEVLPVSLPVS